MHLKNKDPHRCFSAAFLTPARDDSGAAHILEHCMFCGSRKYPLKDPFHELAKGSMYTFLNAMTYRDRTVYPVASLVEKDFCNLMDVYLDSVFAPSVIDRPEAFLREGWRYEVRDGVITGYGGIVYNEMRGAYASPRRTLNERLHKLLYPDTQYGFDSGGDPEAITGLSFERFADFFKTHYAPGNARLFVYGDVDIKAVFGRAEGYLRGAKPIEPCTIAMQRPARAPIYDEGLASADGFSYASGSFAAGDLLDGMQTCALEILERFLLETDSSPLRLALKEADPGADVLFHYDTSIRQTVFNITLKNSALSGRRLHEAITDSLSGLSLEAGGGSDAPRELLDACINRYEFGVREEIFARASRGLYYNLNILPYWLYGGDPFDPFGKAERIARLKGDYAYFDSLIRRCFVDNAHCAFVSAAGGRRPDRGRSRAIGSRCAPEVMAGLERFRQYIDRPETEENLKKLPSLRLSDVTARPDVPSATEYPVKNGAILFNEADTNGIAYVSAYLNAANISREHLTALGVLRCLLGRLGTRLHARARLDALLQAELGGINTEFTAYTNIDGTTRPMFILHAKALNENAGRIPRYAHEILAETVFDDERTARALLAEECSRLERYFTEAGHNAALRRVRMCMNGSGVWDEYVNGVSFYINLRDILRGWDWEGLRGQIKAALAELFAGGVIVGVTCGRAAFEELRPAVEGFIAKIADAGVYPACHKGGAAVMAALADNNAEGVVIPSEVNHVAYAVDCAQAGITYNGLMPALTAALTNCYLVPRVRLSGGAYGCSGHAERSGRVYFVSFRDPHVAETLEAYRGAFGFMARFDPGGAEFERIIIGAANKLLAPKTPRDAGRRAFEMYIEGVGRDDCLREFDELLSAAPGQLRELAAALGKARHVGCCAFGNAARIGADIFKSGIIKI